MIKEEFERIVKENTRQEFLEKYYLLDEKDTGLYEKPKEDYVCDCPYDLNTPCEPEHNCFKCWENAIPKVKFKDEI